MKWINKQKEEKEKQEKILAEQKRIEQAAIDKKNAIEKARKARI